MFEVSGLLVRRRYFASVLFWSISLRSFFVPTFVRSFGIYLRSFSCSICILLPTFALSWLYFCCLSFVLLSNAFLLGLRL